MKIIEPSFTILSVTDPDLSVCSRMAGLCYRREKELDLEGRCRLIRSLLSKSPVPHDSIIEHGSMSVVVTTSRAIGNQFTRHRGGPDELEPKEKAVYSQESTRWCNLDKKSDGAIACVMSLEVAAKGELAIAAWERSCQIACDTYRDLLGMGLKPESARDVLPMCLGTTIGATMTYATWRRVFTMRCDRHADPEIRRWMVPLLVEARKRVPVVFDDVGVAE